MRYYKKECKPERFTDKSNIVNERGLMEDLLVEATNLYGTKISYFTHGYTLTSHDYLYGEDVTAHFGIAVQMVVLAEMNQDSLLLSKFGIMNDADLTIIIPIKTFSQTYSATQQYPEPKSGDLIRLDELGVDRPGGGYESIYNAMNIVSELSGLSACKQYDEYNQALKETLSTYQLDMANWLRGAPVFEVTERRDLAPQLNINRLQSVYAWHIKAKRYDYSYEPNAPIEQGKKQVSDETFFGRLSGGANPESPPKDYSQNVPDKSKEIFDYRDHGNLDKVYGDYE